MLKMWLRLLGDDVESFRRYLALAVIYGVCCGLTIALLVPIVAHLVKGNSAAALIWLALLLIGSVFCWFMRRRVEQAGVGVGVALLQGARHRLGDHIARLPLGWFTPQHTAWLSHLVTQGVMSVSQLPAHVLTPVIVGAITPIVLSLVLWVIYWPLGLLSTIALPVLIGALYFTSKLSRRADDAFHHHFAAASQRVVEFAQAQSVLRAFNGEGGSMRLLESAIEEQHQAGSRLIWLSSGAAVLNVWLVQAVFAVLLVTIALWATGVLGVSMATEDIVGVVAALLLVVRFIDPLLDVVGYSELLRSAHSQLSAIDTLLSVEVLREPNAPKTPQNGDVLLRNVCFRYAVDQPDVLKNVNVTIPTGSMTALIGDSGSGKTTLTRLIARFFDATNGKVIVGGVDVREISSPQLASHISQIFQDTYLFSGSIADNIRLGKPDASDAEVRAVAEQASLTDLISRLPQGLDTPVGEGGMRLSGGERQRVAIARALIKNAPILLVDEATAALDAENQAAIADVFANLRGRCTVIVIAHQLSTVKAADQIVVLDNGKVVEQGAPAELEAFQGHYAQFLSLQSAAKGWRIAPSVSGKPERRPS